MPKANSTIGRERDKDALSRKERFLVAFRKYGMKSKALEDADITFPTLRRWIEEDEVFAKAIEDLADETHLTWKDDLEEAGLRRALSRSDQLLMFFLKKLDPSYREKSELEHRGSIDHVFRDKLDVGGL